ncbi:MAG: metal-dependent hydrolase [Candidatus Bathyarchaeia archaeon]
MIKIKWLSNAGFEIISEKGKIVYIDPFLSGNLNAPIGINDIKEAHIVLVTHGHRDHMGDAIEICRKTNAILIAGSDVRFYAKKMGITPERIIHVPIGGTYSIHGIEIRSTDAKHESFIEDEGKIYSGIPCGYLITLENKMKIYHAGDTGLFSDMKSVIGEIYKPDIALLPIGGRVSLTIEDATIATSWIRPKLVIPMHYGLTDKEFLPKIDSKEFEKKINEFIPDVKVVIIKPGEAYRVNSTLS